MTIETAFVADERILLGVAATLTSTRVSYLGEPADAVGAVTVSITRGDGTALTSGTATSAGAGVYTFAITAAQNDRLDLLAATWTGADGSTWTSLHEVVGGFYFTVAEAKQVDTSIANVTAWNDADIRRIRDEVEVEFEGPDATRCAWVPRYARARVEGTGDDELVMPNVLLRRVRSATIEYRYSATYTLSSTELASLRVYDSGVVCREDGFVWPDDADIVLEYEHGRDRPDPRLKRAAIHRCRSRLTMAMSGVPDRAESFVSDAGGRFVISTPGLRGAVTGIPDVDVVLKALRFPDYGIA